MAIEKAVDSHKTTRRRARLPDPQELLGQLEDADLRLLQWLLRYPFQRAEDLALATGSSVATVYRHLNILHNSSLVERVIPATLGTGKCWLYHLSNLGLQVLAVHEVADAADLALTWRTDERCMLHHFPEWLPVYQTDFNRYLSIPGDLCGKRSRRMGRVHSNICCIPCQMKRFLQACGIAIQPTQ